MKRLFTCAVALLCCLSLLATFASAAKVSVEGYEFPDNWSHDALVFAVENGILAGDKERNLHPDDNITRAEMAAVLVRLLGATEAGDLSAYTDVHTTDWFYTELAAAVGAGVFNGTSATTMEPNAAITREQAAVVLSRAFGVVSSERGTYQSFGDWKQVSAYARDAVSAMKQFKIVNGYEDGTFRPRSPITRAEVAQLLYKLFDCIADTPDEIPASGWVLYRGKEALPSTLTLDGTLILGPAMPAKLEVEDWKVSGTLVVRTGADTEADLTNLTAERLVCAPSSGTISSGVSSVCLWGGGVNYTGVASELIVMGGSHTANGGYPVLQVRGGSLKLNGSSKTVTMDAKTVLDMSGGADEFTLKAGAKLTLGGTAGTITLDGADCTVNGAGSAETVVVRYGGASVTIDYNKYDDSWYQSYQKDHDTALETVKTMRVACTVLKETKLYSNGQVIRTLPVGTIVYNEWHPAGSTFFVSCTDGTQGWVNRWDCDIPDDTVTTDGSLDYSKATKEGFADLKGYSSETEYLIWVSLYTQKVIVFKGEFGDWEVIKTFPCSSGANNTPTPAGVFVTSENVWRWDFDNYYVSNVTIFNGDHAFHSILLNYGGGVFDGRTGIPLSHGCIRMELSDCKYISDLPLRTTVVIY